EARRWDWGFVQSNTAAGSFNFNNVFTAANPLSPGNTGYSFASYLLGTPSSGSLAGAAKVFQQIYYEGYYLTDSYRVTNSLTLNLGVRLDVDGSFSERYNRTVVWQPGATDPLGQQVGMNLKGQLAFVDSPAYPSRNQLGSAKPLAAPRVGIAWSAAKNTVIRTGYGLSWVSPEQINYSLPPFQSAINAATTTMVTSVNGGLTPLNTLSNPFPGGLIEPLNNNPAGLARFEGQSFNAPIPGQPFTSVQQWNFQVQHQFAQDMSLDVGYAGAKATHLAFSVLAINKLPDQYLSMGAALLNTVPNPFYGVLPASAGTLSLPTVTEEQLLRPYPQFLNLNDSEPQKGDSTYHALQTRFVKRFRSGGTVTAAYTWSKLLSDTDTLTSWLEASHGVGGVQDPSNLRLEKALASFDVANRLVISYVYDLPLGKGKHFLAGLHGAADRLVSGWGIGGITTFQSGLPLALTTASNLTGSLGGGSRPNVISPTVTTSGSAQSRLNGWFNTAAYAQPASFTFGSESRTDPVLRSDGINNFDFTVVKHTSINERFRLEFRSEFFNLFNRVQFADPGTILGTPQFGVVTSAGNLPRLVQLGLRLSF
ncbi:MAG: TonB-dependent receptor, partial [Acidobacteriia bacterium]|nr:TonB-dependent receptor [Terriglobia bacterium]